MNTRHAPPVLERLWARTVAMENGCWIWTGAVDSWGYGTISDRHQPVSTHRLAYETLIGPIPLGLTLDHLCREKRCINPLDLEPVTTQENTRRRAAAMTHCENGHLYDAANTYIYRGRRRCRACRRIRERAYARRAA